MKLPLRLHTLCWLCCGIAVVLSLFAAPSSFAAKKKPRRAAPQDEHIYLVHADRLRYNRYINSEAQILNGKVQFRHKGATLHCDSAYFYEASNSFEAFGHVKMFQGDTLSLFSDYAYYDGNDEMAIARYNVELRNRKTTLTGAIFTASPTSSSFQLETEWLPGNNMNF